MPPTTMSWTEAVAVDTEVEVEVTVTVDEVEGPGLVSTTAAAAATITRIITTTAMVVDIALLRDDFNRSRIGPDCYLTFDKTICSPD
jgi:hypothetical protein